MKISRSPLLGLSLVELVSRWRSSQGDALLVAVLMATIAWLSLRLWHFDFDDPAIVYRIAENLAEGRGWVYNLGERTNASTSALWTLLLAAGTWVFGKAPTAAHLLDGAAWLGCGVLLYGLARQWMSSIVAFLTTLLFVSDPIFGLSTGLELHLLMFWALLAFRAEGKNQPILLGVSLGLMGLTRPDGILLGGVLLLYHWLRNRGFPWRAILTALILLVPWLLFSALYFGSLVPNTLAAKMAQGSSGFWEATLPGSFSPLPLFVRGVIQLFSDAYHPICLGLGLPFALAGSFLMAARAQPCRDPGGAGRWPDARGDRLALVIPIWGILHLIAYSSLGVPAYHWYALPVVLSISFCLGGALQRSLDGPVLARRILGPVVGLVALLGIGWNLYHYSIFDPLEPRVAAYRTVADWIVSETPDHWTVAAAEIGTLGYRSRRKMIDMAGLLHRQVDELATGKLGIGEALTGLPLPHHPAYGSVPRRFARVECRKTSGLRFALSLGMNRPSSRFPGAAPQLFGLRSSSDFSAFLHHP